MLLEEQKVTSLTSPEMTSPGVPALRGTAGLAGVGQLCTHSPWVGAALATHTRGMQVVTAGSPGQAGSTVPARARLHTESRRCSTAGKCRLLSGCTNSTAPSDTCAGREPQRAQGWDLPQAGTTARVTPCPPGCSGRSRSPHPSGQTLLHTPSVTRTGTAMPPSPLQPQDFPLLPSSCSLKGVPVLCPWHPGDCKNRSEAPAPQHLQAPRSPVPAPW